MIFSLQYWLHTHIFTILKETQFTELSLMVHFCEPFGLVAGVCASFLGVQKLKL
jgi:hypothetical protein